MSKEQCPICEGKFSIIRWRYACEECNRKVCKCCLVSMQKPTEMKQGNYEFYGVCKECAEKYEKLINNDPILKTAREAFHKGTRKGYKKGYDEGYDDADW